MGHPADIFSPEPSAGFICAICHDVLRDASFLKECGHTFCDECVRACLENSPSCPNCRVGVTGSNPNYALRDIIESMPVRCPEWKGDDDNNKKRKRGDGDDGNVAATSGCDWLGPLKDLKDHEKVCDFKMIACSVDGCGHKCRRKDMEGHLSSGTGMMRHMELMCENKIVAMKREYEDELGAARHNMRVEMRVELNHVRYVNDCRMWVEHKRDDVIFDVAIYHITKQFHFGTRISGLLCKIVLQGARIPMTFRYGSGSIIDPTCKFPPGFFHLNVCPDGTLVTEDWGWTADTTLPEILLKVTRLLSNPDPGSCRHPTAGAIYRDEGPPEYQGRVNWELRQYRTSSLPNDWVVFVDHPKIKDLLEVGESLNNTNIISKRRWTNY